LIEFFILNFFRVLSPLKREGLRLADINAFAAVPAIKRFCHAICGAESQRTSAVAQAARCAFVMIQDDRDFPSGTDEIQGRPQGTEIAAIKSPGYQVHTKNKEDNHPLKGQGVKKNQGHDLPPDKSWRGDKNKDGCPQDHAEKQLSQQSIPEEAS